MSPRLPDGDPAPADGALPPAALDGLGERPFGVYVHVPFCASRCGYCDFNTYVPGEGAARDGLAAAVAAEAALAARALGGALPPADTVFLGGGTPTLLPAAELAAILAAIPRAPGAEVTVEANPDTVDAPLLAALREAGVTRLSVGMQSAVPHVLDALERTHRPGQAADAARQARAVGFEHVSLDLMYGAPEERDADWTASLEAAIGAGVDHVSAYALTVEPGTRLHAQVRRGARPAPDDDVQARRYAVADRVLTASGLAWYEVASWAAGPAARCRHNLGYWRSHDWWGLGPGAHSHVGGVRWWNVLHPARYAARLAAGASPAAGRETLSPAQRRAEGILLELRLAEGLRLDDGAASAAEQAADDGLLERDELVRGRAVLTLEGRLLADRVAELLIG